MKKIHTSSPNLLAPLQGLWRWLMPTTAHGAAVAGSDHLDFPAQPIEAPRYANQRPYVARPARAVIRPLRIIRVLDHDGSPANNVGRMLISGRMADVCAELDRLVAHEQTMH
jgi:hypothetical protein